MLDDTDKVDIRVISYYGFGGIGKTSLLKKIENEILQHADRPKVVKHDFEDCIESHMVLRAIKSDLEKDYGFEFPFFDIGLYVYLKRCGVNSEEPLVKTYIDNHPKVKALIEGMGLVTGLSAIAQLMKVIDLQINKARNDAKQKRHIEYLEELKIIENKTELLNYLTLLLYYL